MRSVLLDVVPSVLLIAAEAFVSALGVVWLALTPALGLHAAELGGVGAGAAAALLAGGLFGRHALRVLRAGA